MFQVTKFQPHPDPNPDHGENMKLISLNAENFKRLKCVFIPVKDGVTKIVGKNGQGKTSALDAIAAAIGGAAATPEMPIRKGESKAVVLLDLEDYTVEKVWTDKGASIKITAKDGSRVQGGPQGILDKLYGDLSFDPLAFTRLKPTEQAAMLARVAGVDLAKFKAQREGAADRRAADTRTLKAATAQLQGMPVMPPDTPDEEVSVKFLMSELSAAEKQVADFESVKRNFTSKSAQVGTYAARLEQCRKEAEETARIAAKKVEIALMDFNAAEKAAMEAKDLLDKTPEPPDTNPLKQKLIESESINNKVREKKMRAEKQKAVEELQKLVAAHDEAVKLIDKQKDEAIAAAPLPIKGLSITDGGIYLNGIPFTDLSASEQLAISTNIGLALNKNLKLILIRDGSLLDNDSMAALEKFAAESGSQILIERVDMGSETGVIIEDGEVKEITDGNSPGVEAAVAK